MSSISSAHQDLINLIQDGLIKRDPKTAAEAVEVFNLIKDAVAHYLVNSLPSLEHKALALAGIMEKKVGCLPKKK